jgi:glycine/D-amino acid oxidase-like deaminating enzyme
MSDLPPTADIVILGGGVMGASTAYHLAKRGANVVLLERESFFGLGATGRCAGGIRHQFATEVNIRLSLHSLRMLDEFEAETGQPALVRKCGYLFVLTREEDVAAFEKNVELQRSLGVTTQWLPGDEVRRMIPLCEFPDALAGTFNPDDGLADPNSVVMGYINAARRLGAACLTDAEVTGIEVAGGKWKVEGVRTNRGSISTQIIVNAAGPWSALIGRMAGVDVPVVPLRRQWLTTTPLPQIPSDFPFVIDFAQSLYFHREGEGLLTGMSNNDEPIGFDQSVDREWELVHLEAAAKRMPLLEQAGVASRWAGLYEVTPDAHPILGATPVEGFYLVTGFSGHGFMHGPICGLLMAEMILDGQTHTLDVSMLSLRRFAEGREIREYNVV